VVKLLTVAIDRLDGRDGPCMNLGWLHLVGLALNVIGAGLLFVFAYPPKEEARQAVYLGVARVALVLVFFGFLLQFLAAISIYINPLGMR
jgi:hypothetical protein